MWKPDSKAGIICSGAASICLAIAYLIIFANLRGTERGSKFKSQHI